MPIIDGPHERFILIRTRARHMRPKYRDVRGLREVIECHHTLAVHGVQTERSIAPPTGASSALNIDGILVRSNEAGPSLPNG